jgi:hypothetical protein
MSAQELVNWLASLCFPDHCPLKQLAIVNGNLVDLLRHRLGERNGVNLTAIEFADAQKCTLVWRYLHPSTLRCYCCVRWRQLRGDWRGSQRARPGLRERVCGRRRLRCRAGTFHICRLRHY